MEERPEAQRHGVDPVFDAHWSGPPEVSRDSSRLPSRIACVPSVSKRKASFFIFAISSELLLDRCVFSREGEPMRTFLILLIVPAAAGTIRRIRNVRMGSPSRLKTQRSSKSSDEIAKIKNDAFLLLTEGTHAILLGNREESRDTSGSPDQCASNTGSTPCRCASGRSSIAAPSNRNSTTSSTITSSARSKNTSRVVSTQPKPAVL